MSVDFAIQDIQAGDSFDLPPTFASKLIGLVLANGGEVYLDGNIVVIVSSGNEVATTPAPAPVAVEPEPALEPEPEPAPLPVEEVVEAPVPEPEPEPEVVEAVEAPVVEVEPPAAVEVEAPAAPVRRGRKPKAAAAAE